MDHHLFSEHRSSGKDRPGIQGSSKGGESRKKTDSGEKRSESVTRRKHEGDHLTKGDGDVSHAVHPSVRPVTSRPSTF